MLKGLSPQALSRQVIEAFLVATTPKPRVAVAFSGGLDSTVLAHMFVTHRRRLGALRLIHVDHGLQQASREWARRCARQSRGWQVPLKTLRAKVVVGRGQSLEAAAREARYRLLGAELSPGEILVTAQHLEDQAETLLLQLFRGAGVAGLSAMPGEAPLALGTIRRPLLAHSRVELEHYARSHGLEWIDDPTNRQDHFARNYLRNRVMPLLREKWRGVDGAIARSARHMSEAARLLEATATRDLNAVADGGGLNVAALRGLEPARRRNALRAFISRAGIEPPSAATLMEITGAFLRAREDAQPEVRWSGAVIRRRAGRLELQALAHASPGRETETARKSWHWADHREFILNDAGDVVVLIDDPEGPIDLDKLPHRIELRPRQGGETLRPAPRARTQSLKKLLQAARLTVEERARLPLLFAGEGPKGRLIAAGRRWIDASVQATVKSRRRARLEWKCRA
jgi:tRNA(Ile)-lysidine synthase